MSQQSQCEFCLYYEFDDDTEEYFCSVAMDEDDLAGAYRGFAKGCPYFCFRDDYKIAQKQ